MRGFAHRHLPAIYTSVTCLERTSIAWFTRSAAPRGGSGSVCWVAQNTQKKIIKWGRDTSVSTPPPRLAMLTVNNCHPVLITTQYVYDSDYCVSCQT